jgi:hypothetical protein
MVHVRAGFRQRPQHGQVRRLGIGGVGERHAVGGGQLARDAADADRVAPVRGHRDLEDLIAQPRVGREVRAQRGVRRQHDDARVVLPHAELIGRADHALRHVAVGLARGDLEPAGQHRAGQHEHDPVADGEVGGTADDAAQRLGVGGQVCPGGGDPAVPDRLLELGQLLDRLHLRDDQAVDVADGLMRLDLKAGRGQPPRDVGRVGRLGDGRVLAQPGKRYSHR